MIVCGWCHAETPFGICVLCGRDAALPWVQRSQEPPTAEEWDRQAKRRQIEAARRQLGPDATVERIAELIGVDPRTVRRWMSA